MSAREPVNLPASVRARLKNRADELGMDLNQVFQYYAMERFLYRLSKTSWAERLIVKGAAMLRVWDGAIARPTKDIIFLGNIDNSPDAVAVIVKECLAVESGDGLEFSPNAIARAGRMQEGWLGACSDTPAAGPHSEPARSPLMRYPRVDRLRLLHVVRERTRL